MKNLVLAAIVFALSGCATLTEDAMTDIALSFSDGSAGKCQLDNKRGSWAIDMPGVTNVRKSDDALKYSCETKDGRTTAGAIKSEMGAKIIASAVFIDFGIVDAITDKHRKYAGSFVIPIAPLEEDEAQAAQAEAAAPEGDPVYKDLEVVHDLHARGILSDEEFEAEKKRLLERE